MIYYRFFAIKMKAILKPDNQYSFQSNKPTRKTWFLSSHMMQNAPSSRNPLLKIQTISVRWFRGFFFTVFYFFIIFIRNLDDLFT